ncbi:MAG TPA: MFS transporter [Rhizomicrobium sp.]|nr:MFS transporter [Rhizomicrobium sp.]
MTTKVTSAARLRAIFAGSIGNLVEWYDWYAYSAAALYFAPVFFPKGDQTAQLLQTAGIFAVGFFARPVGAWIMGRYSDRFGRKRAMVASVALMCLGSLVIAFTPGAAQIGVAAPAILLLARILQGLSLGGEYGVSATYMSEVAGKTHRGFWSSFNYVTLIGGQLTALLVLILLQHAIGAEAMGAWGWRVPFVIGAILAVAAFYLRGRMEESQSFVQAKASGVELGSTRMLLRRYPRETLTVLGLTAGGSLTFYIYTTYMQKFLTNTAGFTRDQATELSAATLVCFMLAQPLIGWISDKVGRKPLLIMAFGGGALITWPVMNTVAQGGSAVGVFFILLGAMLVQAGYTAINAVVKAELYPSHIRTLGVALPYALANATFGGTAEYVALWFKSAGIESGFYIYSSVIMAVGFLVVLAMPDTRQTSQIQED